MSPARFSACNIALTVNELPGQDYAAATPNALPIG